MRPDLEAPYAALRDTARSVARVAAECRLEMDVDEYVDSFRPGVCGTTAVPQQYRRRNVGGRGTV